MTPDRHTHLRTVAAEWEKTKPFVGQILTECLNEIAKLQHDKQAATNAANRAIKAAQRGR